MFDIIELSKGSKQPSRLNDVVRSLLLTPGVWALIEPYLLERSIEGSTQYDHAKAVMLLREADKDGALKEFPVSPMVFRAIQQVTTKLGLRWHHGRVIGLLSNGRDSAEPSASSGDSDTE